MTNSNLSNGCTARSVVLRESFGSLVLTYVDITALSLDGAVFLLVREHPNRFPRGEAVAAIRR